MATVKDILDRKGDQVWSIGPEASVLDATHEMNKKHIGALLVVHENQVIGIFTERDILTRVIGCCKSPEDLPVSEVMTSPVAYVTMETSIEACKTIFTEKRIRHMPVMDSAKPVGVIATGDIMAYETNHLQETVKYLQDYIYEG